MLKIDNLHARIGDTQILKGLTLSMGPGEVHAIMGQTAPERAPSPAFSPVGRTTKSPRAASNLTELTCSRSMPRNAP